MIRIKLGSRGASQKAVFFIAKFTREDFIVLCELIESGKVTPVVERTYPLSKTAEAMRHIGTGHAQGKIVIEI
jgi:NADPH:quinone reductase-like Zn-dependent oxidoreductase